MALLFEGTLTLDGGQPIPARLELAIDLPALRALAVSEPELAALLGSTSSPTGPVAELVEARQWATLPEAAPVPALPVIAAGKAPAKGFEPIEIRPHSGRRITSEIFAQISDPAKIWAALAERFPWAGFKVPTGTPELTAGDLDMDHPAESNEVITQLDSDWLTIEPHLSELVDDEGRPRRGYQSRIAEYLGGTNDGHFRRARVEPLVSRLKKWIAEEWVFTSASPGDDEGDEESGEVKEK